MQSSKNEKSEIGYSSIAKVKQILDCFTFHSPSLTAQQIAQQVTIPTSSLYRYLHSMVNAKFLSHDKGSNTYSVGMYAIELAGISLMQYRIRYAALPELNILSSKLQMNANLSVLDGCDIFHLGFSIQFFATPWVDAIGRRTPAYHTAMGRSMLAFLPFQEVREMIMESNALYPETYPLPDFDELRRDFDTVHQRQCLMLNNAVKTDISSICIASPVRKRNDKVCAAISVNWYKTDTVDSYQSTMSNAQMAVLQSAAQISYKLGYVGTAYSL